MTIIDSRTHRVPSRSDVVFASNPAHEEFIGFVMQHYGFTQAFYVAAGTYIAGMILLLFVKEEPKPANA